MAVALRALVVAYILLVCIGVVGVLGVVAMVRIGIASIQKGRAQRARLAARERLVAESRSIKQAAVPAPAEEPVLAKGSRRQPAVAMPEQVAPRARAITPAPIVPLARGELTGVISLLDQSARFALDDPPAPPPRLPKATRAPRPAAVHDAVAAPARKQRPTPPMPAPVAAEPFERPAWADGVVPRRARRDSPEPRTAVERPMPPARTAKPSAPPPVRRAASAAPHVAPSQPSAPTSLVRAPARPPAGLARETVNVRRSIRTPAAPVSVLAPTRAPHGSVPPPVPAHGAPATRIPVPPAPVHHAPAGQTRLPVPPLPAPPPRRTRSS